MGQIFAEIANKTLESTYFNWERE